MVDKLTTPTDPITSTRFSFSGYSIKTWAIKNKDFLIGLTSLVFGTSGLFLTLSAGWGPILGPAAAGASALIVKFVCNCFDFWQSE